MAMSHSSYLTIFALLSSFILLIIVFRWCNFIVDQGYVYSVSKEEFTPLGAHLAFAPNKSTVPIWARALFPTNPNIIEGLIDRGTPETSHTVSLPINDPVGCKNSCAVGRCSVTGQQCLADVDCPGCNPYVGDPFDAKRGQQVVGNNDAGKLTAGVTPRYSSLTTDIGTMATVVGKEGSAPPQGSFGPSVWGLAAGGGIDLYNKRYRPQSGQFQFKPNYTSQNSVTGLITNREPRPSNY